MTVAVGPGPLRGRLIVPASKSYTHRALVAAASLGVSLTVRDPLDADDTRRTRRGLARLGYPVRSVPGGWWIGRRPPPGGPLRAIRLECGESGTTLRFLAALAARDPRSVRFGGSGRLPRRPMAPLLDALRQRGVRATRSSDPGSIVEVRGPMAAGPVRIPSSESSQFASSMLLALAGLAGPSRMLLPGRRVSAPYLDATVGVLRVLGASAARTGPGRWRVGGGRRRSPPRAWRVPRDASAAAVWWVAATISGGDLTVEGVDPSWPQADLAVLRILASAGARVDRSRRGVRVRPGRPRGFVADLTDAPDLLPLVGVLAARSPGRSIVRGASHAALKESDRRRGTAALARSLGAEVRLRRDRMEIRGFAERPTRRPIASRDHRVVIAAAIAALTGEAPDRIRYPEAVRKSYPSFWRDLRRVGGHVRKVP